MLAESIRELDAIALKQVMRLGLYLAEPANPRLSVKECEGKWQASLRDEPVTKEHGPSQATLRWLQVRVKP